MSTLTHPDDPTEYMEAMAAIMIVGTTVDAGSVSIEKGLDTGTKQFPGLIINCPNTAIARMAITGAAYQATFSVKVAYLDRWESSTRTLEEALADAKTALYQMARNIRAQPALGLVTTAGQALVVQADMHQRIQVDQATRDLGFGFPLVTGLLEVEVLGPYFLPS